MLSLILLVAFQLNFAISSPLSADQVTLNTNILTINNPHNSNVPLQLKLDGALPSTKLFFSPVTQTWTTADELQLKILPLRNVDQKLQLIQLKVTLQSSFCLHPSDTADSPWFIYNRKFSQLLTKADFVNLEEAQILPFTNAYSATSPAYEPLLFHRDGFLIILDDLKPWHLDFNATSTELCLFLEDQINIPPILEHNKEYFTLSFRLIIAPNLPKSYRFLINSGYLKRPQSLPTSLEGLFNSTVLPVSAQKYNSKGLTSDYIKKLKAQVAVYPDLHRNFHLTLDSLWFASKGSTSTKTELDFDSVKYDYVKDSAEPTGYLSISVDTQLSNDTSYEEIKHHLLQCTQIPNTKSNKKLWQCPLDFTQEEVINWFTAKVHQLVTKYNVAGIFCENAGAMTFRVPRSDAPNMMCYAFSDPILSKYGNLLSTIIGRTCQASGAKQLYTSAAFKTQAILQVIVLPVDNFEYAKPANTELLKTLRKVLATSLAGYPLLMPQTGYTTNPNSEIHVQWEIRWLKVVAFMPVMQVPYLVKLWSGSDAKFKETLNVILQFRKLFLVPVYLRLMQKWLETGEPVIRPLWYNFPDDREAFKVEDQFMIGETILVAPIVQVTESDDWQSNPDSRAVYFPKGANWYWPSSTQNITICGGSYRTFDFTEPAVLPYFIRL